MAGEIAGAAGAAGARSTHQVTTENFSLTGVLVPPASRIDGQIFDPRAPNDSETLPSQQQTLPRMDSQVTLHFGDEKQPGNISTGQPQPVAPTVASDQNHNASNTSYLIIGLGSIGGACRACFGFLGRCASAVMKCWKNT